MDNNFAKMWLVFVIAGMLWLPGFLSQKVNNRIRNNHHSIAARGIWAWVVGVRRGERVYLRPASMQAVGLWYLVVGFFAIWFYDLKTVLRLGAMITCLGLIIISLVWFVIDVIIRR